MAKNIILLSDGTGNSSNALNKSNVWRIMQMIDVAPSGQNQPEQLVFYDNGVGSTGAAVIKKIMGAFGFGLSRNVRDLYEQLCRHYEPGDKIYILGFSRGAFTARVLAHFIGKCGILDIRNDAGNIKNSSQSFNEELKTDRGLKSGVADAYRSYRQWYWDHADGSVGLAKLIRTLWYKCSGISVSTPEDFKNTRSLPVRGGTPQIHFVGVWDTVDAMGMPIKELSDVIDKAMYPYKFPDHVVGPDVAYARQALAIDDERHSFTPLPWDECFSAKSNVLDGKTRLRQVWFAGMHADIGGGYSEDTLSLIPLDWMIREIIDLANGGNGLRFLPNSIEEVYRKTQSTGKIHDSRRGLAAFYRYKPRSIPELCGHNDPKLIEHHGIKSAGNDKFGEGKSTKNPYIATPIIHYSVIDRLKQSFVGYAPAGLPEKFNIFRSNGKVDAFGTATDDPEKPQDRKTRTIAHDRAGAHIWWGRTVYFLMLMTLVFALMIPWIWPYDPALDDVSRGWWSWLVEVATAPLTSLLPGLLSGPISAWTKAWVQSPILFLATLALLLGEYVLARWIHGNIQRVSEYGWSHMRFSQKWDEPKAGRFETFAQWVRKSGIWLVLMDVLKNVVLKAVFVLIVIWIAYFLVSRAYYHVRVTFWESGACAFMAGAELDQTDTRDGWIVLDISKPCTLSKISVLSGIEYRVHLKPVPDNSVNPDTCGNQSDNDGTSASLDYGWQDQTLTASPKGLGWFDSNMNLRFWLASPYKRHVKANWMALIGETGKDSGKYVVLSSNQLRFTAPGTGNLHLYVNDAVAIWPLTWLVETSSPSFFYNNNKGKICLRIERL